MSVPKKQWIVVIGVGVWARCYGLFDSDDEVMAWVRANQFDVENAHAYPVFEPRRQVGDPDDL